MSEKQPPATRQDYKQFMEIPTRWMDNDAYGHVNNVQYYSYFDTVVNSYLIEQGVLDIQNSPVIGLVVETQCRYFSPITFPEVVHAGIRVARIGNSSVRYEVGLFTGDNDTVAAEGHFIHVYVTRSDQRPASVPGDMRKALERILADD